MAVLRVTLFQKDLQSALSPELSKRLARERSDFILLPAFVYAPEKTRIPDLVQFEKANLEWQQNLSESTGATVIGGTLMKAGSDPLQEYCPIWSEGVCIETIAVQPKEAAKTLEESILILKGQRFAVLPNADVLHPNFFAELAGHGIRLVFCPVAGEEKNKIHKVSVYEDSAKKHNMVIVKCAATGKLAGKELAGLSLIAASSGISWRVSQAESGREITKTLSVHPAAE